MPEITTTGLTAHPARPAAGYPVVQGRCPACGAASLFLGSGGYVTCASLSCGDPTLASHVLDRMPEPGVQAADCPTCSPSSLPRRIEGGDER